MFSRRLHPLIVFALMLIMSLMTLFAQTPIYIAMIVGAAIIMLMQAGDKFARWALGYGLLWALALCLKPIYMISAILGSFYAMFLIIIKLYPIFMLGGVLVNYTSVELMRCFDLLACPQSLSLTLAIIIRFLPDFKARALEIMQAGKVRGLYMSILHPLRSFELVLIPLTYRMLETSETLSASIITKGFEYPVKKTCYRKHQWNVFDGIVLLYAVGLVGAIFCQQIFL